MPTEITIHIREEAIVCPKCGATELSSDSAGKPASEWKLQIKAFRVDDWSHCLMCDCWFNLAGAIEGEKK